MAAQPAHADLGTLLAAFDSNYSPARHLQYEASGLAEAALIQAHAALPRLGFEQSLRWRGYEALDLHLSLDATVPLYRAATAPIADLQAEREEDHSAREAAAAVAARAEFVADALALALVLRLGADADRAASRFVAEVWAPPSEPAELFFLGQPDRELLALFQDVAGLSSFADEHVAELTDRLALALGTQISPETWPAFDSILASIELEPPTLGACLEASPDTHTAASRHRQKLLDLAVDQTLDFEVDLFGALGYTHTLGATAASSADQTSARLGIEARIYLPETWPVTADIGAKVGLDGAEQHVRVAWPPAPPGPAAASNEADLDLAEELEYLTGRVKALFRARADAWADVQEAEARLLWLARDHHPDVSSLASARAAAHEQFPDPVVDLYAVTHRADLAFAQLGLARAALDLQALCGTGAWAAGAATR